MKFLESLARWLVLKSGFVPPSGAAAAPAKTPPPKYARGALDAALRRAGIRADGTPATPATPNPADPFAPSKIYTVAPPPPGVIPTGTKVMSMDEACNFSATGSVAAWAVGWAFHEGIGFLGYPYLAEIAQRPEYRRISEIIAKEMTRKWITLTYTSTDGDKSNAKATEAKLAQVEKAMKRLKVRGAFRKLAELDGYFGRSHLYIDLGPKSDEELQKSIGNGDDDLSKSKVKQGSLRSLKVIEPLWTYPNQYNSNDPLADHYYRPQNWFVQGKLVDASRLLTFVGREVSDLLKPAYSFGGLALSQIAKPYVDNWLRTRQSVSDLIHSFTVFCLATDMQAALSAGDDDVDGAVENFFKRIQLFNQLRDNKGTFVTNKDTEEFSNVEASLASLDKLQAQAQEHMAAVSGIPLVKLLGISPSGLNPSTADELRCFYDWIEAQQEALFTDPLSRIINFVQLSEFGAIDPNIGFKFNPLWTLDALQMATKRKTEMDTDQVAIDSGVIEPVESRTRLAAEEDSPYSALDLGKKITPPDDGAGEAGLLDGLGGELPSGRGPGSASMDPPNPKGPA